MSAGWHTGACTPAAGPRDRRPPRSDNLAGQCPPSLPPTSSISSRCPGTEKRRRHQPVSDPPRAVASRSSFSLLQFFAQPLLGFAQLGSELRPEIVSFENLPDLEDRLAVAVERRPA